MSAAPALLSDGQVILTGKSRIVYLLNGAHLGGIGGQQAALGSACSQDIDGGVAVQGTTAYLPCRSGIIAVRAVKSPAALHLLWSSATGGGPPIVAAGLVWTISQNGTLYGLSSATGTVRQQVSIGGQAGRPFPDSQRGRRPAVGSVSRSGGRLHHVRPRFGQHAHAGPEPGPGGPRQQPAGDRRRRRSPCQRHRRPPHRRPGGDRRDRLARVATLLIEVARRTCPTVEAAIGWPSART